MLILRPSARPFRISWTCYLWGTGAVEKVAEWMVRMRFVSRSRLLEVTEMPINVYLHRLNVISLSGLCSQPRYRRDPLAV